MTDFNHPSPRAALLSVPKGGTVAQAATAHASAAVSAANPSGLAGTHPAAAVHIHDRRKAVIRGNGAGG